MKTKLFQLQMPIALRDRLKSLADIDRRSMSAEAIVILEQEIDRRLSEIGDCENQVSMPETPEAKAEMLERVR